VLEAIARRGRQVQAVLIDGWRVTGDMQARRGRSGAAADVGHGQVDGRTGAATGTAGCTCGGACCRHVSGTGVRADGGHGEEDGDGRPGTYCRHASGTAHAASTARGSVRVRVAGTA